METPPTLVATKPLKAEFGDYATITLSEDKFTLGRSLGNSVVIAFLPLSRRHCIFRKKNNNLWTIEDLSAFGVRLNGNKLERNAEHQLTHNDVLHLDQTGEFIYKFIQNEATESMCPPNKKVKMDETQSDEADILKNAKQKFEESQSFEVENLEKKIKDAKQLEASTLMLKRQLEEEMKQKVHELNSGFEMQIESLRGEKQEVERQKAELEAERDAKMADMHLEMDNKITELKEQIGKHSAMAAALQDENSALKERLVREREEFLVRLRESEDRAALLQQLQDKCLQQEETREHERRLLEAALRRESEQLMIAEEQCRAREEAERKLKETQENTEKSLETIKKQVAEKEVEMSMLAEQRVQLEALKSSEKVNELQEELNKVKTELECEKIVRLFSSTPAGAGLGEGGSGEGGGGGEVRAQFGDLLESELQCTVCADLLIAAVTLNCSHTFCKYCIAQWKKKKKDCPICRTFITSECRSLVIDSFIDKMVENLSDEMKQRRLQILREREELEIETSKETVQGAAYRGGGGGHHSDTGSDDSGSGDESDASSARGSSESHTFGDHYSDHYYSDDYQRYYSGGGGGHHSDTGSDDSGSGDESDASSARGPSESHTFGDHYSDHYYSDDYQRYYRPEYFDYDSGSDLEPSDEDEPGVAGASGAGTDASASGGSGALGPDTGAAGARGGGAARTDTASRSRSRQVIAGVPGSYYGGYGRCYSCGARGHWAPGCPFN